MRGHYRCTDEKFHGQRYEPVVSDKSVKTVLARVIMEHPWKNKSKKSLILSWPKPRSTYLRVQCYRDYS